MAFVCKHCGATAFTCSGYLARTSPKGQAWEGKCRPGCGIPMEPDEAVLAAIEGDDHDCGEDSCVCGEAGR